MGLAHVFPKGRTAHVRLTCHLCAVLTTHLRHHPSIDMSTTAAPPNTLMDVESEVGEPGLFPPAAQERRRVLVAKRKAPTQEASSSSPGAARGDDFGALFLADSSEEDDDDDGSALTGLDRVSILSLDMYANLTERIDQVQATIMDTVPAAIRKDVGCHAAKYDSGTLSGHMVLDFPSLGSAKEYVDSFSNFDKEKPVFVINVANSRDTFATYVPPEEFPYRIRIRNFPLPRSTVPASSKIKKDGKHGKIPKKQPMQEMSAHVARDITRKELVNFLSHADVPFTSMNFGILTYAMNWVATEKVDILLCPLSEYSMCCIALALEKHPALDPKDPAKFSNVVSGVTGSKPWHTCDFWHPECTIGADGARTSCPRDDSARLVFYTKAPQPGALPPHITQHTVRAVEQWLKESRLPFQAHYNSVAANQRASSWMFVDAVDTSQDFVTHAKALRKLLKHNAVKGLAWQQVRSACDACGILDEGSTSLCTRTLKADREDNVLVRYRRKGDQLAQCPTLICTAEHCGKGHHGRIITVSEGQTTRRYQIPPTSDVAGSAAAANERNKSKRQKLPTITLSTGQPFHVVMGATVGQLSIGDPYAGQGSSMWNRKLATYGSQVLALALAEWKRAAAIYGEYAVLPPIFEDNCLVPFPQLEAVLGLHGSLKPGLVAITAGDRPGLTTLAAMGLTEEQARADLLASPRLLHIARLLTGAPKLPLYMARSWAEKTSVDNFALLLGVAAASRVTVVTFDAKLRTKTQPFAAALSLRWFGPLTGTDLLLLYRPFDADQPKDVCALAPLGLLEADDCSGASLPATVTLGADDASSHLRSILMSKITAHKPVISPPPLDAVHTAYASNMHRALHMHALLSAYPASTHRTCSCTRCAPPSCPLHTPNSCTLVALQHNKPKQPTPSSHRTTSTTRWSAPPMVMLVLRWGATGRWPLRPPPPRLRPATSTTSMGWGSPTESRPTPSARRPSSPCPRALPPPASSLRRLRCRRCMRPLRRLRHLRHSRRLRHLRSLRHPRDPHLRLLRRPQHLQSLRRRPTSSTRLTWTSSSGSRRSRADKVPPQAHAHVQARAHVCGHRKTCTPMHTRAYVRTCARVPTHTQAHMQVHGHRLRCACTCVLTYVHAPVVRTHNPVCTCEYTATYVHAHARTRASANAHEPPLTAGVNGSPAEDPGAGSDRPQPLAPPKPAHGTGARPRNGSTRPAHHSGGQADPTSHLTTTKFIDINAYTTVTTCKHRHEQYSSLPTPLLRPADPRARRPAPYHNQRLLSTHEADRHPRSRPPNLIHNKIYEPISCQSEATQQALLTLRVQGTGTLTSLTLNLTDNIFTSISETHRHYQYSHYPVLGDGYSFKPLNTRACLADYGLHTPGPHVITYIPILHGGSWVHRGRLTPHIKSAEDSDNDVRAHMERERSSLFQEYSANLRRSTATVAVATITAAPPSNTTCTGTTNTIGNTTLVNTSTPTAATTIIANDTTATHCAPMRATMHATAAAVATRAASPPTATTVPGTTCAAVNTTFASTNPPLVAATAATVPGETYRRPPVRVRVPIRMQSEKDMDDNVRAHMKRERTLLFDAHKAKRRRQNAEPDSRLALVMPGRAPVTIMSEKDLAVMTTDHVTMTKQRQFQAFQAAVRGAQALPPGTEQPSQPPPVQHSTHPPTGAGHEGSRTPSDIEVAANTSALLDEASLRIECSTGVDRLITNLWSEVTPVIRAELARAWPVINLLASDVAISTTNDVVRIRTMDKGAHTGGTIRYVTPIRTWAYTIGNGTDTLQVHPPVPSPMNLLPKLTTMMGGSQYTKEQMELRLTLLSAVPPTSIQVRGPRATLRDVVRRHDDQGLTSSYHAGVAWDGSECICCKASDCKGGIKITASRFARTITMRCKAGATPHLHRMSKHEFHYLFGGPRPGTQTESVWLRPGHDEKCELDLDTATNVPRPEKQCAGEANDSPHPNSLTVVQLNLDKRGRKALGHVLSLVEETKADIVGLQEIENVAWPTDTLSRAGWNFYRHKKVGLLVRGI